MIKHSRTAIGHLSGRYRWIVNKHRLTNGEVFITTKPCITFHQTASELCNCHYTAPKGILCSAANGGVKNAQNDGVKNAAKDEFHSFTNDNNYFAPANYTKATQVA